MDYGRRPYASPSKDYKTFIAEITDQYVKSIGGVRPAGLKRPYKNEDYNSMQYLFDIRDQYLGGRPPTLEDLGQSTPPIITTGEKKQLLILNFEGANGDTTWVDEAQSLSPSVWDGAKWDYSFILTNWNVVSVNKKFGVTSLGRTTLVSQSTLQYIKLKVPRDFTWHGWIYSENLLTGTDNIAIGVSGGGSVTISDTSSGLIFGIETGLDSIGIGAWHHVAVIGYGETYMYFLDGVLRSSFTDSYIPYIGLNGIATLYATGNITVYFDAWELVSYAKWKTDFTPPRSAPVKDIKTDL